MKTPFIITVILIALFSFLSFESSFAGVLVYSTYLGGGGDDWGWDIALDSSGNAYITGYTHSSNFPTTTGVFDTSFNGGFSDYYDYTDVFVSKLNSSGTALVYSTYLGGGGDDEGYGIAIDSSGNAYITGYTQSTNFPTTPGAFDTSGGGVFVTKLNPSGTALVYSTYLNSGIGYGIAVDGSGNAYITGVAGSGFPTTPGAFDTLFNGGSIDVFVSKLNASGSALAYSTYLGGGNYDNGYGIAIDGSGNAYITGWTSSSNFPATPSIFDTSYNGADGFVSKLSFAPLLENIFYSDINQNSLVDQGDTLLMQFDKRMRVNSATASDFSLLVTGDTLDAGATVSINTANDTQVVIALGTSPTITIPGLFNIATTTPGSPSGVDISATMSPNAIEDLNGNDAQDKGNPGINDSGVDILNTLGANTVYVSAFSAATVQVSTDTVNNYYTQHRLIIPANSLSISTTITIGPPGDNRGQLSALSFSPSDITFNADTPATLVVEYKDADTKREAGFLEYGMRIHQWNSAISRWEMIPETYSMQSVDTTHHTVSVKINKLNMVDTTGSLLNLLDPPPDPDPATITLPSVGATTTVVTPSPGFKFNSSKHSSEENDKLVFLGTSATITVGTKAIYNKHKVILTNYYINPSGTYNISLFQATLDEKHGWSNNAVMTIRADPDITSATITLIMEYKDHYDLNTQLPSDVKIGIGGGEGKEYQMRIYKWNDTSHQWEKILVPQFASVSENLVSATLSTPLYKDIPLIVAVGVDGSVPSPLNSDGEFDDPTQLSNWDWRIYGGVISKGTLSLLPSYTDQSGITQTGVAQIYQTPGEKGQLSKTFTVDPSSVPGWFTASARVATDIVATTIIKQQKVYLYLQELASDLSIAATGNVIIQPGQGGFGNGGVGNTGAGVWRDLQISFYVKSSPSSLGVQVVGINPGNSGANGNLYIDNVWVVAGAPQPSGTVTLINPDFNSNITDGWMEDLYGGALAGKGTWDWWGSDVVGRSGLMRGSQTVGQKAQHTQYVDLPYKGYDALCSVWVYSGATLPIYTQKVYLYVFSLDGSNNIIESANAILQPGQWDPGGWRELKFGFIPLTKHNAVQLVGINKQGSGTELIYFDTVSLQQD
jgi:hypothetical protein